MEENIIEFLSEETFCEDKKHKERIQNSIRQINKSQNDFNQIIEIMHENGPSYEESCIFDNNLGFLFNDLDAYGDIISIESDVKIILKCYYSIFKYITDILKKSHNNILKDTLAITISG